MKPIVRACLAVSFLSLLLVLNYVSIVQASSSDRDTAKYLLDRILDNRNKVKNFKCTAEYHTYMPKELMQEIINSRIKKTQERLSPKKQQRLARYLRNLDEYNEYTFLKERLALDNEGLTRVEMITGISDINGSIPKESTKRILIWDGKKSINYIERSQGRSAILSNRQHLETSRKHRQPWRIFGGIVCDRFAKAIANGTLSKIERMEDGTYHVEFLFNNRVKNISVIDPSQGYSVTLEENYVNGQLEYGTQAKFGEVSPNIWFPVEGEMVSFSRENPAQVLMKATINVSEIIINDPNFYDDLFHVDFPKGTLVSDHILGLRYVVGEPMSEGPIGAANVKSLHEVTMDMLEEMAKEIEQKHEEIEIFIPKVSIALKKRTIFILDLSDRKLISAQSKPNSEKAHKYLTKIGKGDIAWDGTVVAIRGASVLTTKQESKRPLKFTKGKWSLSYKLPKKVELPYSMLIVTKEKTNYLITVRKIESGGIRVTYRKLYPDELSKYKQESKDKQG